MSSSEGRLATKGKAAKREIAQTRSIRTPLRQPGLLPDVATATGIARFSLAFKDQARTRLPGIKGGVDEQSQTRLAVPKSWGRAILHMSAYGGRGTEDDRVALAARRIVRQYHLEQSDRSEDSAFTEGRSIRGDADPDNIHSLRLALDEMSVKIEHMQRLMVNREALFMAALERIERNVAKSDGRIDALTSEMGRIESRPLIDLEAIAEDQRIAAVAVASELSEMMSLSRSLLDEVREFHNESLLDAGLDSKGGAGEG